MPDNNRKTIDGVTLSKLNAMYYFEYDAKNDVIITKLSTCKRTTVHDASQSFHINAKRIGRKVVFSTTAINIWKSFCVDGKLNRYSLFDIQNAVNKLKIMYQEPTRKSVLNLLLSDFHGITRLS